ncbi:hypothetical protein FOXYSP1_08753 [Fusarium oxysporum f. sp. phaseoli]
MSSIKLIIPREAMFNTGFQSAHGWTTASTSWNILYYTAVAFGVFGFYWLCLNGVYTDETGRQTVFDAILDAEADRSTKGLVDEAFSLVIGGTETTVTTITYGVWCILKNPNVEKKMLEELRTVETNSDGLMEYQNLMNLPYQTAVIHETLHISSPAPGILTRLVPSGGTRYGNHFLPADTSVSTAQRLIHYDPTLFPEPETFMPE